MDNSHFIERIKERYGIDANDEYVTELAKYIHKHQRHSRADAMVIFLENRWQGALFFVRLNDFSYSKKCQDILVVTNDNFVPKTVIPFDEKFIRYISSVRRRRVRGLPTPVYHKEEPAKNGYRIRVKSRLRDHYDIDLTEEMWTNFRSCEYVSQNVGRFPRHRGQQIGRIVLNGKEVFVVLKYGMIDNIIPSSFIGNKEAKVKRVIRNQRQYLISDAIKRHHVSFT